ncbi:MAG: hypothetical protein HUK25_09785 [Treponema sp.]|nr:hypothetical protein [Treponema sp.]
MKKVFSALIALSLVMMFSSCLSGPKAGSSKLTAPESSEDKILVYGIISPYSASINNIEWRQLDSRKPVSTMDTFKNNFGYTAYYGFCDKDTLYKLNYIYYSEYYYRTTYLYTEGGLNMNSKFDFKTKKSGKLQYLGWKYMNGSDVLTTDPKEIFGDGLVIGAVNPLKDEESKEKVLASEKDYKTKALTELQKQLKGTEWEEVIAQEIASLEK